MEATNMRKAVTTFVLAALLLAGGAVAQQKKQQEIDLQAAMRTETVEGDLQSAIEHYKKIVAAHGGNRAVAAKALVQMGQCYEKLGNAEAQKAYERVLRDYADQRELAAEARTRLSALGHAAGLVDASAMTVRRSWAGPDTDTTGAPSLDGRYLSYVDWATGDLAVRDLATGEKRRLTNKGSWQTSSEYAYFSTISPDGRQVAYAWCCTKDGRFDLRLISVNAASDGTKPRVLYSNGDVFYLQPRDWSPDGNYVLATFSGIGKSTQLALISVTDGSVRVLKTLDWRYPQNMSFSPDGRYIAYDFPPKEDSPDRDIFVLATDGSRETALVEHPGNDYVLGWAPDGKRILFASDRTGSLGAWAIPVAEGKPQGPPELVKGDIGRISPMGFTRKGAFYYGLQAGMQDIYIATLDMATGKVVAPATPASRRFMGANSSAAWSPDGEHLAYLSQRDPSHVSTGPRVLRIRSLESGQERELSHNLSSFFTRVQLRWSPDGRSLLASANDNKGRPGLYQIDVQTGAVSPVVQGTPRFAQGVWSQDGKAIFYAQREFTSNSLDYLRVRDLETGRDKEFYRPASPSHLRSLALSPDGRWLALSISRREASNLLVVPAAGGDPRELLKLPGGEDWVNALEWTQDGSQLLFSHKNELWRIPAEGGEAQRLGLASNSRGASVSIHPDGRRIAFSAGEPKFEVWVMENLLPSVKASR